MNFTQFELNENILKGINDAGFTDCTAVQAQSYPITLKGEDLLAQSQTGSGKTAAFLIPVFENLINNGGKALIIAPTRELALQIWEEAKRLGKYLPLKSGCFYGGTGYQKQEESLKKGVDITIGTPGRLLDFGKSGKIKFNSFTIIVVDEADRLFDMGFYPDIQTIMRKAKKPIDRQTMLFSATLSLRVRQLAWEYMNNPQEVEIEPETIAVEEIEQTVFHVSTDEKMSLLLGILKRENPETVLIFTNTKNQAAILSQKLNHNGYKSMFISGDLPQKKRMSVINKIKNQELSVLTATDVAARGLHIDDLPLVINYDIPEDYEVYVHRIGRTARAGKKGKAITLACEKFVFHLEAIENYINKKIDVEWVSDDLLEEDLSKGKPISLPNGRTVNKQGKGAPQRNQRTGGNQNREKNFKPSSRPQKQKNNRQQNLKKPTQNSSKADRLAYYQAKYGEDFSKTKSKPQTKSNKKQKAQSETKQKKPINSKKPTPQSKPHKSGFFQKLLGKKNKRKK